MVSVADTGDNLVLMGVDATYCVVDEVNTTASALHDVFLQEAISSASNGDVQVQQYFQAETCTQKSILSSNGPSRMKSCKQKNCVYDFENEATTTNSKDDKQIPKHLLAMVPKTEPVFEPSLLRAALLGSPKSFQEPGVPGKLLFCMGSSKPSEFEYKSLSSPKDYFCEETSKSAENGSKDFVKLELLPSKPKKPRTREKHYQCGVCFKWFGCKSHVVEHMRTHTGEKPFQCPLCNKAFSQKSNIYQHMNTHTLERPFRCDDCGKDFMYRGSLYKHKRLHTGERPYTCGICSRRFTHASQLFEHIRTHTNEKPFKCSVCGRAFAHSGTMHRHKRNHFNYANSLKKNDCVEAQETENNLSDSVAVKKNSCSLVDTCLSLVKERNGVAEIKGLKLSLIRSSLSSSSTHSNCTTKDNLGNDALDTSMPSMGTDCVDHSQSAEERVKVRFRCEICGHVFSYKRSLRRHERRHERKSIETLHNNLKNKLSSEGLKDHGMMLRTKSIDGVVKSLLIGNFSKINSNSAK
ncbi:zinc finger protein 251-like isoform X2 [Pomacea canaliculata]|nr:zinc finger protein 251-like isoform X2 [Pomacea canaliculata]XP_025082208.1 zinc finger protein 251-like isoform X2 [Pomacea canaliculata]